MEVIRHVTIRGRVQGVGYRAWTQYKALRQGVAGWVRNRRDGSVEAVFAGSAEEVARMIAACHRGPRGALVETVDEVPGSPEILEARRQGEQFSVLATL
ncbi:MAG: acylphosphatase [Xanthobacteraceae bacterium]